MKFAFLDFKMANLGRPDPKDLLGGKEREEFKDILEKMEM